MRINCYFPHRFDLDQLDTPDKYPERFTVMLNFKVSPKDRPPEKNRPWDRYDVQKLSPRILFSSKDELHEVAADYGEFSEPEVMKYFYHTIFLSYYTTEQDI